MAKCMEKAESHCLSYPRCYGCGAYREPTNADRIRAMSDEELAEWILWTNTVCDCCAKVQECDEVPGYKMCKDGVTDWLKQPVRDGEDDVR